MTTDHSRPAGAEATPRVHGKAYVITNLVDGKRYVGITVGTLERRLGVHMGHAKAGSAMALHVAMREHGFDAFAIEHVASATSKEDLGALEARLIEQFGTFFTGGRGYNLTRGGDGTPGRIVSAESRERMSRGKMGIRRPQSEETRRKISEAMKGRPKPAETVARMSAAQRGKVMPAETRAKISASKKGVPSSASHTQGKIGRAQSPEARAKRAESMRRVWEARKRMPGEQPCDLAAGKGSDE